jgi:hypothetical protein
MVNRREAVAAECAALADLLRKDTELIDLIVASFATLSDEDRTKLDEKIESLERRSKQLAAKVREIEDLAGDGDEDDRHRRKGQIRAAQAERSSVQLELIELKRHKGGGAKEPVTREQVQQQLDQLLQMLDDAVAGNLGPEVLTLAAEVFRALVGGKITVDPKQRPGRDRWLVKASFTPALLRVCRDRLGALSAPESEAALPVEIWLKKPPRVDLLADEVQHLYDVEKLGFRRINKRLEEKYGEPIGTGNCCAAYRRYYEVRGLPLPPPRGKAGRPRKAA